MPGRSIFDFVEGNRLEIDQIVGHVKRFPIYLHRDTQIDIEYRFLKKGQLSERFGGKKVLTKAKSKASGGKKI